MARLKIGILVTALALATGGCVAHGRVSGSYVATSDPMLVEIRPGVWVIEDYGEPVFYADGFYWLHRDDVWYRSTYYTGGWVRYRSVPRAILRVEQPRLYVRYHAEPGLRVRQGPRGRAMVRDHRHEVRDEQRDRREERREDREERREDREERRDDRRDDRDDKGKDDKGKGDKGPRHKHHDN